MSRFTNLSFAFSLLPVAAVFGVMVWQMPRGAASLPDKDATMVYQSPSPRTDPVHVTQLRVLMQTVATYDAWARAQGLPRPSHAALSAEYALIVRETTPAALQHADLPATIH